MRSLMTFSSRPSRRLALVALFVLAATVVNGVPAKAAAATHLQIDGAETSITAMRQADTIIVSARDGSNAVDSSFGTVPPAGAVTFTASCGDCFTITPHDAGAGNETKYTFSPLQTGEMGTKQFSLVWKESAAGGPRTLTATAASITPGTASGITVLSNAPVKLDLTGVQTGAVQHSQEVFGVKILNPQGQDLANDYLGTVTFSASCASCFIVTPNNGAGNTDKYTFVDADNSAKDFQLTWTTFGAGRTFTATGSGLTGPNDDHETRSGITVQEAPATTTTSTTTSSTTTSTTAAPRVAEPMIVTGAGPGGGPHVIARAADNGAVVYSFFAYAPNFTGGVRVATGDVNNDGFDDIITAAGPGGGPHIEVFSGKTGVLFASFFAYQPTFTGGVFVAAGDVNNDGRADIITGADAGGGPHVRVFDATKLAGPPNEAEILGFFAYSQIFHGGVRVAAGDFNNDNKADIVTAPGPGGGPHVIVVNGVNGSIIGQFMAYGGNFTGGVFVGADQGGEGLIYTGAGPGGGEHVRVLNLAGAEQLGFLASAGHDGALPAVGDSTGPASDVFVVSNNVTSPQVRAFDFEDGHFLGAFPAYGAPVGVFVAVGVL